MSRPTNIADNLDSTGYFEMSDWNFVSLAGKDRVRHLHNFCTANISQLKPGECTEAFILNEKGRVLWFGWVIVQVDQLLLCGASQFGKRIVDHLEKYVIREDVQLADRSGEWNSWFVFGDHAGETLSAVLAMQGRPVKSPERNRYLDVPLERGSVGIAALEIAGWGFLLVADSISSHTVNSLVSKADLVRHAEATFQARRIQHRIPWYGADLDESNLPQEVNRDDQAISFTKGCYLGQETVARLDALGHVNQFLVGLELPSTTGFPPGMVVERAGKKILRVTSVATWNGRAIGLGYVRTELNRPGTEIESAHGLVRVLS
jgi:folate-binding protein YgfZ